MLLENPMDALVIGNRVYYKVQKAGLSEDGEIVEVAESIDYGFGVDDLIFGIFE